MPIKIQSTQDFGIDGVKTVIYGGSGVGKTRLALTAKDSILLSAEKGLLSLQDEDYPYMEITKPEHVDQAYELLRRTNDYKTIILDTVSEIGEVLLTDFLLTGGSEGQPVKDPRKAYGLMAEAMMPMIRKYRDMPGKNIVFLAKLEIKEDEDNGIMIYRPMFPGQVIKNQLPFMFDGIYYMSVTKDKGKNDVTVLQTKATRGIVAKDRSGKLDMYERPDIDAIIKKATGG